MSQVSFLICEIFFTPFYQRFTRFLIQFNFYWKLYKKQILSSIIGFIKSIQSTRLQLWHCCVWLTSVLFCCCPKMTSLSLHLVPEVFSWNNRPALGFTLQDDLDFTISSCLPLPVSNAFLYSSFSLSLFVVFCVISCFEFPFCGLVLREEDTAGPRFFDTVLLPDFTSREDAGWACCLDFGTNTGCTDLTIEFGWLWLSVEVDPAL